MERCEGQPGEMFPGIEDFAPIEEEGFDIESLLRCATHHTLRIWHSML